MDTLPSPIPGSWGNIALLGRTWASGRRGLWSDAVGCMGIWRRWVQLRQVFFSHHDKCSARSHPPLGNYFVPVAISQASHRSGVYIFKFRRYTPTKAMMRCAHVPYAPTFSAPRELVLRFAHPYECPHSHIGLSAMRFQTVPYDILKSQIAPENTKNAAYTRKPYSMAAQIERPNRAARSDGPIERPQSSGQIGRPQPNTPPTTRPNRTDPTERPRSSGQIERSNQTPATERPDRTAPYRTSQIKQPNPNRPRASQSP